MTELCSGFFAMYSGNQRFVKLLYLSAVCAFAFVLIYRSSISWSDVTGSLQPDWPPVGHDQGPEPEVIDEPAPERIMLVVASQTTDNTTWLDGSFPSWERSVYLTDAPSNLGVPVNKGRESMVYLTYIIDKYDDLPSFMIFQHANRYQWHNDDPLYDGQRMLSRLKLPFVKAQGYVNLRCVWTLGCPAEIRPIGEFIAPSSDNEVVPEEARAGAFYKSAFEELFPGVPVPEVIGASCCAQFAVTADKVRERPKSDYENYRRWLLETRLPDDISGRILEYSWHSMDFPFLFPAWRDDTDEQ
ncbi:hypothetical protein MBLNU13_g07067t1 [Cladosporium sp. NU13]